jgi:hypothetical protein
MDADGREGYQRLGRWTKMGGKDIKDWADGWRWEGRISKIAQMDGDGREGYQRLGRWMEMGGKDIKDCADGRRWEGRISKIG